MRRFLAFGPAFVVLIAVAAVLVLGPGAIRNIQAARSAAMVSVARTQLDQNDNVLEQINTAVRNIASAVEPSVVHIDVIDAGNSPWGASGSGWIFDASGHIVTNAHVVSNAGQIQVQLFDGRVAEARLVGQDLDTDIAVLKIDSVAGLIPARRATNTRLLRGDTVFAFGSPFGFKFSMSEGIVSGLGRSARTAIGMTRISNFIQTDAAVNPGNSGGPLVNVRGDVIGMNVAIATAIDSHGSGEGQSAGISFAIPLPTIESRVEQLIRGGPIVSGYMGVLLDEVRAGSDFAGQGVAVSDVFEESPADLAGVKANDIITAIDGENVSESAILISMIAAKKPGDSARLKIWRDRKVLEVDVTLVERPADSLTSQFQQRLLRQFGLGLRDEGDTVVVNRINPGSAAAQAGLVRGQIVRSIAGLQVKSANAAISVFANAGLFRGAAISIETSDAADPDKTTTSKLQRKQ
jgi:S1-C subfamily serine protease